MDPKTPLEVIEERRAARKAEMAKARDEQYTKDLEALDALEVEHGDGCVASLEQDKFVSGIPTLVVIKTPSEPQYRRFCQQARKAVNNPEARAAAQNMLAESCWVYPATKEDRDMMLAAFPGILLSIAIKAAKMAEFKDAEEGKG